ncbi:metal ABC transporter permease [Acetobacter sp. AN02]|uniref:metal ABC transporter permease n=1 Tax=Acetobacter sp. AN02 TaxID=2894186 RepID=UPI002434436E|nr:metal ABC transporter permease [Acetobacter sp. AN02]MDG6095426.1 metal ABC transporter permease [Acetobacter sp. AN02]
MLQFEFMRLAFLASGLAALLSGVTGWFLVLRRQSFAGHALSHIGFAGAAASLWAGLPPLAGLMLTAGLGGTVMGTSGARQEQHDVAIGLTLAFSMGAGMLFLHLLNGPARRATALLFGNVMGIDTPTLICLTVTVLAGLAGMALLARPLLFLSLQPELAEARGVPVRLISGLFLGLTGLATAACAEVTGVLLVFTLMIGPGATALRLGLTPLAGLAAAAGLAVAEAWGGLALAWQSDAPVSFCIALLSLLVFGLTTLRMKRKNGDVQNTQF